MLNTEITSLKQKENELIVENERRIENRLVVEGQEWQRKLQEAVKAKEEEKDLEIERLKRRIQELEAS